MGLFAPEKSAISASKRKWDFILQPSIFQGSLLLVSGRVAHVKLQTTVSGRPGMLKKKQMRQEKNPAHESLLV